MVLRGKVTAYPEEKHKGLVEVSIGAYHEENDTIYARVEQSMAGVYWLPEIGDVVEVEVPDLPGYEARVVHIHRGADDEQVDVCWAAENNLKQFKTRSGHTVTLDDTEDAAALLIHTAGGLELRLEDKPQTVTIQKAEEEAPKLVLDMEHSEVLLAAGKKLTVSCGGATISIDDGGNISIEAKGDLSLRGKNIALSATSKASMEGQQAEIKGSATAKIEGQSKLSATSSGITEVKGGMVKLN